jgi:hypothetical protein
MPASNSMNVPDLVCCRGLYMMDLVQQARYLSSNSGGSWFNSAFSYQVSNTTPGL